jgi:LmbE family N-acetylglucosaminyl deacetylase
MTRRLLVLVFAALVGGARSVAAVPPTAPLALGPESRVMVFAPHPDDETVGVGGLLHRLARAHVPVRVAFMTNGDGYPLAVEAEFDLRHPTRDDYLALGRLRQQEAMRALGSLGLGKRDALFLGFPDGGLAELWREHWSRTHPYTSPYTQEDSPPYPHAVERDVEYDGQDLLSVVTRVIRDFRPTVIVMPHPSDTHEDHVHTGYFVTEAVSNLEASGKISRQVTLLSYLVHFPSWPDRRGPSFDRQLPMDAVPETHWAGFELSNDDLAAKRAALARYDSQLQVMHGFLMPFLCRNELYGNVSEATLAHIASMH